MKHTAAIAFAIGLSLWVILGYVVVHRVVF